MKLHHESLMPYGEYKGYKMSDVPPHELLFIKRHSLSKGSDLEESVLDYINDNLEELESKNNTYNDLLNNQH